MVSHASTRSWERTDTLTDGQTYAQTDRQTDGWTDRRTDIRTDGQTERRTDRRRGGVLMRMHISMLHLYRGGNQYLSEENWPQLYRPHESALFIYSHPFRWRFGKPAIVRSVTWKRSSYLHETSYKYQSKFDDMQSTRTITFAFILF